MPDPLNASYSKENPKSFTGSGESFAAIYSNRLAMGGKSARRVFFTIPDEVTGKGIYIIHIEGDDDSIYTACPYNEGKSKIRLFHL